MITLGTLGSFFVDQALNYGIEQLISERKRISSSLRRGWSRWQLRKRPIVVFGPGGVGKSTTGVVLSALDPNSALGKNSRYVPSNIGEDYVLGGAMAAPMFVPPGQEPYRKELGWSRNVKAVRNGNAIGVLNVVSYGYHAYAASTYKEHELYKDGMTKEEFLALHTASGRESELKVLESLERDIASLDRPTWLVTLVTKQDLWWNERKEVHDWYTNPNKPYGKLVAKIQSDNTPFLMHRAVSAAFKIENFREHGTSSEILCNTAPGYEDSIRMWNLLNFIGMVTDLTKEVIRAQKRQQSK